ncbi:GGDEF domain-containing protein [Vibrio sp. HN007]|uniref:GGDEF domain-containing protein n=1 Tax=Vibrio iocasae TaxID=3098914 RepID=UPI0035D44598
MCRPIRALQTYVDNLVSRSKTSDVQSELRLHHYIWLVFIAIPLSVIFAIKNIWVGNVEIAGILMVFLSCLAGSLALIPRIHIIEWIYHANNFVFILMVTLVSVWGAKSEGQILWSYTYPLLSVYLFGHRYGLRWSLFLLGVILTSLTFSDSLTQTYSYDFKARYAISYLCILMITTWLEYGRSRYIRESTEQKQILEQERNALRLEIEKREKLEKELENLASIDDLTELYNRRFFWLKANDEIKHVQSLNSTVTMAILDIDRFKRLNDKYGHPAGDDVLRALGAHCKQHLRSSDIVGRIGGEEFAIMLPFTSIKDAKPIIERFHQQISQYHFSFQGEVAEVTVSIGMCELSAEVDSVDRLYALADQALYEAKENGRNRIVCK